MTEPLTLPLNYKSAYRAAIDIVKLAEEFTLPLDVSIDGYIPGAYPPYWLVTTINEYLARAVAPVRVVNVHRFGDQRVLRIRPIDFTDLVDLP